VALEVFCTLEELWRWLGALLVAREQSCLYFPRLGDDGRRWRAGEPPPSGTLYAGYVYPRLAVPDSVRWADQREKVTPCIFFRRGSAKSESVLLKTEFFAHPIAGHSAHRNALNWLRAQIKKETSAGVLAVNRVTGGSAIYQMRFTAGALDFLKTPGNCWQTADSDRTVYTPAPATTA
jgi:hypothetical protein